MQSTIIWGNLRLEMRPHARVTMFVLRYCELFTDTSQTLEKRCNHQGPIQKAVCGDDAGIGAELSPSLVQGQSPLHSLSLFFMLNSQFCLQFCT